MLKFQANNDMKFIKILIQRNICLHHYLTSIQFFISLFSVWKI